MSEFDSKAQDWDKNTLNHLRAVAIADQLKNRVKITKDVKAMEFGAGTALLGFLLTEEFQSLTLIDSSREMIRVCNEKIAEVNAQNIQAIYLDLESGEYNGSFDLIFSQMAFHHLSDIQKVLKKLYGLLENEGFLAVADLYEEDGSFHGDGFTGHMGFDPEWLSSLFIDAGFRDVGYETCYIMKRPDSNGIEQEYPIFLMIGRK